MPRNHLHQTFLWISGRVFQDEFGEGEEGKRWCRGTGFICGHLGEWSGCRPCGRVGRKGKLIGCQYVFPLCLCRLAGHQGPSGQWVRSLDIVCLAVGHASETLRAQLETEQRPGWRCADKTTRRRSPFGNVPRSSPHISHTYHLTHFHFHSLFGSNPSKHSLIYYSFRFLSFLPNAGGR
jgi:hypothetical protein